MRLRLTFDVELSVLPQKKMVLREAKRPNRASPVRCSEYTPSSAVDGYILMILQTPSIMPL